MRDSKTITLFLCGDVMTGRGIDQIMPWPSKPALYESCVDDAREYVQLAERLHGPILAPVGFEYIWGDTLNILDEAGALVRIINLETSITSSPDFWPEKGIHYRMSSRNIGCLTAAKLSACSLANNHVLDWGYDGLLETIETLERAGIACAGAGKDAAQACAPAIIRAGVECRVLLFSMGTSGSGIPLEWAADEDKAGVNLLRNLSDETVVCVGQQLQSMKQAGDFAIASIHWGGNWGYEVLRRQVDFAHHLIDAGFDLIHGHSSHHPKGLEIYNNRLILYGCGDFINDYEGITGYEEFRPDLALMHLVKVNLQTNFTESLRIVPLQRMRFRLRRASKEDASWLCDLLNRLNKSSCVEMKLSEDNSLLLAR